MHFGASQASLSNIMIQTLNFMDRHYLIFVPSSPHFITIDPHLRIYTIKLCILGPCEFRLHDIHFNEMLFVL